MAGAEFAIAQRQVAVAPHALVVDENVAGTVHRLHRVIAVLGRSGEHVLAEVFPMPGLLPEAAVEDLRRAHLVVAVVAIHAAHVLLDLLPDGPAFRMPEHESRRR